MAERSGGATIRRWAAFIAAVVTMGLIAQAAMAVETAIPLDPVVTSEPAPPSPAPSEPAPDPVAVEPAPVAVTEPAPAPPPAEPVAVAPAPAPAPTPVAVTPDPVPAPAPVPTTVAPDPAPAPVTVVTTTVDPEDPGPATPPVVHLTSALPSQVQGPAAPGPVTGTDDHPAGGLIGTSPLVAPEVTSHVDPTAPAIALPRQMRRIRIAESLPAPTSEGPPPKAEITVDLGLGALASDTTPGSRLAGLLAFAMGLMPFAPNDGKAGAQVPPQLAVLVLGLLIAAFAGVATSLRDERRRGPRGYAALALRPG